MMPTTSVIPSELDRSLLDVIWQDLQPFGGRLHQSLRIALSSLIVLVLMLVLQMPFVAYGLYMVFLIAVVSQSPPLTTGIGMVTVSVLSVAVVLAVVIFTDNDPMVRLLSVPVVTFLVGMLMRGSSVPSLASALGFLYCIVLGFWEQHTPSTVLVNNSLRLLAAFLLAITCTVAVELAFDRTARKASLHGMLQERLRALAELFQACADGASLGQRKPFANRVSSFAAEGISSLLRLRDPHSGMAHDDSPSFIRSEFQIEALGHLLEAASAFGFESHAQFETEVRDRCARLAETFRYLAGELKQEGIASAPPSSEHPVLLARVEILSYRLMQLSEVPADRSSVAGLESQPERKPLILTSVMRSPQTVAFALKLSLCATVCYIIYHAIAWPGISSSVTTVMVTLVASTSATKHRLLLRIAGAVLGGVLLGLGSTVFLFPSMDSLTSLCIMVGCVAFGATWIGASRKFGYIGAQIAFSFYLATLAGPSAPTELAGPRDRVAGILMATVLMWFVFDQMWPTHYIPKMRDSVAGVLKSAAEIFRLRALAAPFEDTERRERDLRRAIAGELATIRALDDRADRDLWGSRTHFSVTADLLADTALAVTALVWTEIALERGVTSGPHRSDDHGRLSAAISSGLEVMVDALSGVGASPETPILQADRSLSESMLLLVERYDEVRTRVLRTANRTANGARDAEPSSVINHGRAT